MSMQPNIHKRGRSLGQRSAYRSQQRLLPSGVEVGMEELRSDSEYDSDVIVVGKGRKCPRISETPPNHGPSTMRMLPASQASPQMPKSPPPPAETATQDPALLEWYSQPIHGPCLHAIEVQELRTQVGYLQLEAQRNIELRTELHEDYCRVTAEVRELRETVNNLAQQQKWDVLRRHLDANRWKEFEIEREIQLRSELEEAVKRAIDIRWAEKIQTWEDMTQSTAALMEGIITNDNPMPAAETNSETEHIKSSGGLNESRHASNPTRQNTAPIGPKILREKFCRKHRCSKVTHSDGKNRSQAASELQRPRPKYCN
jgi:hypothetical protein